MSTNLYTWHFMFCTTTSLGEKNSEFKRDALRLREILFDGFESINPNLSDVYAIQTREIQRNEKHFFLSFFLPFILSFFISFFLSFILSFLHSFFLSFLFPVWHTAFSFVLTFFFLLFYFFLSFYFFLFFYLSTLINSSTLFLLFLGFILDFRAVLVLLKYLAFFNIFLIPFPYFS